MPPYKNNKTILIIDNDLLFARKLGDLLKLLDCDATVIINPEAALKLVENQDLLLAVINYDMPEKSATELLKSIKSSNSLIPVIMVSTNPERSTRKCSLDLGADEFYLKQSDFDKLLFSLYRKISASK